MHLLMNLRLKEAQIISKELVTSQWVTRNFEAEIRSSVSQKIYNRLKIAYSLMKNFWN